MKRKIGLVLAFVFMLSALISPSVLADGISLYNNNTDTTTTRFTISNTGDARVFIDYKGYPNITTSATISVKIEKRVLLAFWDEVIERTFTVTGESYSTTLIIPLDKTGTYRCTVTYTISGTGGADDEIVFQDTASY